MAALDRRKAPMFEGSLLKRSDQLWKLILGCALLPLTGLGLVIGALNIRVNADEPKTLFYIIGVSIPAMGFVWALLTVRCKSCGARLLWKAVREKAPGDWLYWLMSLSSCPVCGRDTPAGPSLSTGREGD